MITVVIVLIVFASVAFFGHKFLIEFQEKGSEPLSPYGKDILDTSVRKYENLDGFIVGTAILIGLAVLALAWFLPLNPIFLFATFIIAAVIFIPLSLFSDKFVDLANTTSDLQNTTNTFVKTFTLFTNLKIYLAVFLVLLMVIAGIKIQQGGPG